MYVLKDVMTCMTMKEPKTSDKQHNHLLNLASSYHGNPIRKTKPHRPLELLWPLQRRLLLPGWRPGFLGFDLATLLLLVLLPLEQPPDYAHISNRIANHHNNTSNKVERSGKESLDNLKTGLWGSTCPTWLSGIHDCLVSNITELSKPNRVLLRLLCWALSLFMWRLCLAFRPWWRT